MATFSISTRKYVGDKATIVCHGDNGEEIPVMHLIHGEEDFPGDLQHLAANIVSLLNGTEPLHKIDIGDNRIFWSQTPHGPEFRIQQKGDV